MPESVAQKKRRYERVLIPKGLHVAWQASGGRQVSRVGTVGLGGIYIHTPDPPPSGEMVRMVFNVPGGEVRAKGVVRHSTKTKGMGIEFTSMQPEDRARLSQLLSRLLRA